MIKTIKKSRRKIRLATLDSAQAIYRSLARGGRYWFAETVAVLRKRNIFQPNSMGRFEATGRRGLAVMALTADTTFVTAWANDLL